MNRLFFHVFTLGMVGLLALCPFVGAGPANASEADETVKVMTIGDAAVWAVADSKQPMDMRVFPDADPSVLGRYVPSGKAAASVMVFVVHQGDDWILIDTGLGEIAGGKRGGMMAGLKKAGIQPEKITRILLTHMHGDHIGGLIQEGKRVFPNASVLVSRSEFEFWKNPESARQYPQFAANFELARNVLALYANAVDMFAFDTVVAPGIRAVDASGHTPGHTAFLLTSGGQNLLFIGDIIHAAALQLPRPDINPVYDMNPAAAAATRIRLLEQVAKENLPIAGAHFPFPAIGGVKSVEGGGFQFAGRLNGRYTANRQ